MIYNFVQNVEQHVYTGRYSICNLTGFAILRVIAISMRTVPDIVYMHLTGCYNVVLLCLMV